MNLSKIVHFKIFIILILTWSVYGQASPFVIEYSREKDKIEDENNDQFELNLLQSYEFVTQKISDRINRKKCPVHIKFIDLKGEHTGFTPFNNKPCSDKIFIDLKFERSFEAKTILVHELTHLLRHQYNSKEDLWLDEGVAVLIQTLFNEPLWPISFEEELRKLDLIRITNSESAYSINGYGYKTSYFLLQYLYNHLNGESFLKLLLKSPQSGWKNIETVAAQMAQNNDITIPKQFLNRKTLLATFAISLLYNSTVLAPYGMYLMDFHFKSLLSFQENNLLNFKKEYSIEDGSEVVSEIKYFNSENPNKINLIQNQPNELYYFIGFSETTANNPEITKITFSELNANIAKFNKWKLVVVSFYNPY